MENDLTEPYVKFEDTVYKAGSYVPVEIMYGIPDDPQCVRRAVMFDPLSYEWEIIDQEGFIQNDGSTSIVKTMIRLPEYNGNYGFGVADVTKITNHNIETINEVLTETWVFVNRGYGSPSTPASKQSIVINIFGVLAGMCVGYIAFVRKGLRR